MSLNLLVYRFSALGDVAMLVNVFSYLLEHNPNLSITFITNRHYSFLFQGLNTRLNVIGIDFKQQYQGHLGTIKLALFIRGLAKNFDGVCDLHQVLRTKVINLLIGKSVQKIKKNRKENQQYVRGNHTIAIEHVALKYLAVFRNLKLKTAQNLQELKNSSPNYHHPLPTKADNWLSLANGSKKVLIAPFARHQTKIWPIHNWPSVFKSFNQTKVVFYLLGGGEKECSQLEQLQNLFPFVTNITSQMKMNEEVSFMKKMDLVVTMDSANMHLASIAGVNHLGIWGGTSPALGFSPISNLSHYLGIEDLKCRPCSVYGKNECPLAHFECMNKITPDVVVLKIKKILEIT